MKKFKVYKSSAGSGKTFTLVKEYLKLCLAVKGDFGFTKILAITFTNKASQEMKDRILLALEEISKPGDIEGTSAFLKADLIKELGISESLLRAKSSAILSAILHNYADFNVSTIDKFSHKLVRTFAKDLGLSMNFKVDLDEATLLEQVVSVVVSLVGINEDISNLIVEHASGKITEGKSWNPSSDILDLSKTILSDDGIIRMEKIKALDSKGVGEIKRDFYKLNQEFESSLVALANRVFELIDLNQLDRKLKYHNQGGVPSYFKKIKELKYSEFTPGARVLESINEDKWYSGKLTETEKCAIDSIVPEIKEHFYECQKIIENGLQAFISRRLVSKNLSLLVLLKEIISRFAILKTENRLVPISDFNKKIAEVVLHEPMPFIYERIGEKYDHIMIDEFQDTSVMQFMNLLPLVEESLSRGKFNMIVGDAKQAIYRFRGGEVEQFSEMPNYLPEQFAENDLVRDRLLNLSQHYSAENLEMNYRSKHKVVEFNNLFFESIKEILPQKVQRIYEGHKQKVLIENEEGYVQFQLFPSKESVDLNCEHTLCNIKNCLKDGYDYKDISILCRYKKQAVVISEYLKQHKIPLLSSESLLLASYPEIQFLISTSIWLVDANNNAAKKDMLSYLVSSKKVELELDLGFENYIRNKGDFDWFLNENNYRINKEELKSKSVYEFYESLIRIFNLNEEFSVYLQFFQESTYNFSISESNSVSDFLIWWESKSEKLSISVPEGLNAVQIMTVHKSKGLEFPIVIYPFAEQTITSRHAEFHWVNASGLNEELTNTLVEYNGDLEISHFNETYTVERERKLIDLVNDTYVAFTRATDRLYVLSKIPSKTAKEVNLPFLLNQATSFMKPNDLGFEYGKIKTIKNEQDGETGSRINLKYHSEEWNSKIRLSLESHKKWNELGNQDAREFGNLFHEIMSKINSISDVNKVLNEYRLAGKITEKEEIELSNSINKIISQKECQLFFSEEVMIKIEAALLLTNGSVLRPDRVVYFEDKVAVLDYKTGEANEHHHAQIYSYVNTISETTPLPVEGFLYYLDEFKLEKVV
jgi:ATP-dependent exoDNAse (exonuclease V) beta subunit